MDLLRSATIVALGLSAVVYFFSPIDALPEALFGPFGFIDDLAVAFLVGNQIIRGGD